MYKAFTLPQITYCHTVWKFCCASDDKKLERLQESVLRAIYCDKNSSYETLLGRAKLPTLRNRRLQDLAMLMYIVKNNSVPRFISGLFSSNMGKYNLRNSDNPNDFILPTFTSTTYGKHSVGYMEPLIWSMVGKLIKMTEKLN